MRYNRNLRNISIIILLFIVCFALTIPILSTNFYVKAASINMQNEKEDKQLNLNLIETEKSEYAISIVPPSEYEAKKADLRIEIRDENSKGLKKLEIKIESNGLWQDLTDKVIQVDGVYVVYLEISENCVVYVAVTSDDDVTTMKSQYIECFDRTPPIVRAGIDGDFLCVEATDRLSVVKAVYICNHSFTNLKENTLKIKIKDYADKYKQLNINAVDELGNESEPIQIENPYYYDDFKTQMNKDAYLDTQLNSVISPTIPNMPMSVTSTMKMQQPEQSIVAIDENKKPASSSMDIEESPKEILPFTPNGQGTIIDNTSSKNEKEFYTINTPDENTFYLVVDKQRNSDNVYFLDKVKENDLLSLTEKTKDKDKEVEIAVSQPEPKCICKQLCEVGQVNTNCSICINDLNKCIGKALDISVDKDKEEKSKNNVGTFIFIILAILIVAIAGYYLKIYKPKHDLDDAEDLEDLIDDEDIVEADEVEDTTKKDKIDGDIVDKENVLTEDTYDYDDYPDDDERS